VPPDERTQNHELTLFDRLNCIATDSPPTEVVRLSLRYVALESHTEFLVSSCIDHVDHRSAISV